jgi:predicted nucleotidyltransferase
MSASQVTETEIASRTKPTLETLRARRDEILFIAAAHGASNVRVFGSVARGEDDAESDLDLLVDFDDKASGSGSTDAAITKSSRMLRYRI